MRRFLALGLLLLVTGSLRAGPEPSKAPEPILQVFEPKVKDLTASQLSYDPGHPLMVIQSLKEVHLAQDRKGVMLVLEEGDSKALADMTRDFDGRVLIFIAPGGVTRPINITGMVTDGRLGFKYPEAAPIADALRQYFHLAEFK